MVSIPIRFGLFELDLTAGELRKHGRKVPLQDQPLQVLALLLSRPGEVLTREELRQALWPAGTFVEFDQGLNTAIKKIRLALGDSADNPRFIETIPRKGYRFIAPVEKNTVPPPGAALPRKPRLAWIAAAVMAVPVVATAIWLFRSSSPVPPPVPVPLTAYRGAEFAPSFSPDGNYVAFTWNPAEAWGEGQFDIYVKLIGGGGDPMRLTHDPADDFSPAWSPDGRFIAFLRTLSSVSSGIFIVPAIGGEERKLGDLYQNDPYRASDGGCLSWSPDGKWLVYSDKQSPNAPFVLYRLSLDTGDKQSLTSPPKPSLGDVSPAVNPDGTAIVFSRCTTEMTCDLFLIKLAEHVTPASEPQRLTIGANALVSAWMPDGRALVFSNGPNHAPILSRLVLSRGAKPEPLAFAGEGVIAPAISRQRRLAYDYVSLDVDICRLELNGHAAAKRPPIRLISSTRLEHEPVYSPDGKRIAFCSNRTGNLELWVANADGSNAAQLTSFGPPQYTGGPRWSPDGRFIAFNSATQGKQNIYVISSDGGKAQRLDTGELTDPPEPAWSQDGKWIYFGASRNGQNQLWRTSWPASNRNAKPMPVISKAFGRGALESPDGRFVYFLKGSEPEFSLWREPLAGGEASQVLPSVRNNNYAVVRDGIYFIPNSRPYSIQFFDFSNGKTARIAELARDPAWGFSVSPDGRSLLYSEFEAMRADLKMVENFR